MLLLKLVDPRRVDSCEDLPYNHRQIHSDRTLSPTDMALTARPVPKLNPTIIRQILYVLDHNDVNCLTFSSLTSNDLSVWIARSREDAVTYLQGERKTLAPIDRAESEDQTISRPLPNITQHDYIPETQLEPYTSRILPSIADADIDPPSDVEDRLSSCLSSTNDISDGQQLGRSADVIERNVAIHPARNTDPTTPDMSDVEHQDTGKSSRCYRQEESVLTRML